MTTTDHATCVICDRRPGDIDCGCGCGKRICATCDKDYPPTPPAAIAEAAALLAAVEVKP